MNGWRQGLGYPPPQQPAISTDPVGDQAATWHGIVGFVRQQRLTAEQEARDAYYRESTAIREQVASGKIGEKDAQRLLERATKRRDEQLALACRLWKDLAPVEKDVRTCRNSPGRRTGSKRCAPHQSAAAPGIS